MLKIEQVERYTIARYPARRRYRVAPSLCGNLMKGSAASLVMLAILQIRVPREERAMVDHFGDAYLAYMERTGRVFPRTR